MIGTLTKYVNQVISNRYFIFSNNTIKKYQLNNSMAHPILHAKSSAKKFGGKWEDYIHIHNWLDETKGWYGHSLHRAFRHHSEGIFEMEMVI